MFKPNLEPKSFLLNRASGLPPAVPRAQRPRRRHRRPSLRHPLSRRPLPLRARDLLEEEAAAVERDREKIRQ